MTPQARVQAAIEILDAVVDAARSGGAAADTIIARYFKDRRYAGSKDRRAVRELVYRAIRRAGECPATGRAAMVGLAREDAGLAALFDGSPHGPLALQENEPQATAGSAPAWLADPLGDDAAGLLERAPLDVRVNRLKTRRDAVALLFPDAVPTPHAPDGLRLPEGSKVEGSEAWAQGLVEVQDEGSQLVALATGATAGQTVIDLCAGAGGKTLALAALMDNQGRIVACDADRTRLSRLMPRAERAGTSIVETRLLDGGREAEALADLRDAADMVLVDAPCSGTGTWRRNPEARWRLTPARLERLVALQARLLELAATLVRPGGVLVHVVCSLLPDEGRGQAERFLAAHPGWTADPVPLDVGRIEGSGRLLTPAQDGTDGFFVVRLRRPC